MYTASWCGDCEDSKQVFAEQEVAVKIVDIATDDAAGKLVLRLNKGLMSIPTIVFPNGEIMVEPSRIALTKTLTKFKSS